MTPTTSLLKNLLSVFFAASCITACYAQAGTEPAGECRTVEVRNRRDVEVCRERCNEDHCREHCVERERFSREHRCWVD